MADDNKGTPNAGGDDQNKDGQKKVTFDDDQKAYINNIVESAYTRAYTKAEEKYSPKIASLEQTIADLQKTSANTASKSAQDDKPGDKKTEGDKGGKKSEKTEIDVSAILARLDEVTTVANTLKKEKEKADKRLAETEQRNREARIREGFYRAADKIEFFDRNDVFGLVKGQLDVDENGEVVIINSATKQPRIDPTDPNKNMSLEQYLGDFAKTKPHMVRSNASDGTGAGEARKVDTKEKKDTVDYTKMSKEDFNNLTSNVIARQYTERK